MIVGVERVKRPSVDSVDLSDLTGAQILRRGYVTDPDGIERYEVQFAVNVPAATAEAVQLRLATADANEEATRARAWQTADTLRQIRDSGNDTVLSPLVLSRGLRLLARVALYLLRLQLGRTEAVETEPGTTTTTTPTAPQTAIQASKKA